jgi:hypothetical protein
MHGDNSGEGIAASAHAQPIADFPRAAATFVDLLVTERGLEGAALFLRDLATVLDRLKSIRANGRAWDAEGGVEAARLPAIPAPSPYIAQMAFALGDHGGEVNDGPPFADAAVRT